VGFEPVLNGVSAVLNGFASSYVDETGRHKTEVFGLDKVVKLRFTCFSGALAQTMALVDPAASERAKQQVPAVAEMLKAAGAHTN
jgi:hypothetical protein